MYHASIALPPLRTHGRVVLIDDSADFVLTLETLLDGCGGHLASFTEPAPLHAFLDTRAHLLQEEQAMLSVVWRAQRDMLGTAAVDALRFFARPQRLELPLVLITDYAMPSETGLSVCARHRYPGFERILLTGVADTEVAVSAFNAGLIEQFVRKQSRHIADDIVSALRGRLLASADRRSAQLATTYAPGLAEALCSPVAAAEVQAVLAARDIREHIVLGDPQGILGITGGGEVVWVQLETRSSLEALDDLLQLAGAGPETRRRVTAGQTLVAADFMQQAGLRATEAPALTLCDAPLLVAAVHSLSLPAELLPVMPSTRS